jgi:hypothetical protein
LTGTAHVKSRELWSLFSSSDGGCTEQQYEQKPFHDRFSFRAKRRMPPLPFKVQGALRAGQGPVAGGLALDFAVPDCPIICELAP